MLFGRLATAAAVLLPLVFGAPTPEEETFHVKIRGSHAPPKNVIPNNYIVVYHKNATAPVISAHENHWSSIISKRASKSSNTNLKGLGHKFALGSLKGYAIEADAATIKQIADTPEVDFVELDSIVQASSLVQQATSTWGLGRISHRNAGASNYIYDNSAGNGARVYVVDTGIYTQHTQFGGRATFGKNFITGSPNTDENGHGTHCSGTIGGSTYGVAKKVALTAVKVLDKNGSGSMSGVIAGIQWVSTDAKAKGITNKSVLSMSLGGSYSAAMNSAVAGTVANGITVVVAAGNSNDNAANYSPASEPSAITVGAIGQNDARASFSNYGSLLDVFAPGVNILSAWIGSTTATNTISGTSMATPHVAGLVAYLIALEGPKSPAAMSQRIQALATSNKVTDTQGSPNLIAYNGDGY